MFDLDGVLVDSVEVKTQAFYKIYCQYGENIAQRVVDHHRANGGMSRYDKFSYYHKEFLNQEITQEQLDDLAEKFSKIVVEKVIKADEIAGARQFLEKVCYHGFRCAINSATPQKELDPILSQRNILHHFEWVYGSPASKSQNLYTLLKETNLDHGQLVFFGDAKADYNAAKEVGIMFIGVGDFMKEYFSKQNYHEFVINDFLEIVQYVK
ncbi:MAG: HAD hydrolase-like protein [Gammaproteobacteria bacterium]|nr:HAD hydrolase-like protein [Gammaproteobacteria bacterium]